MVDYTGRDDAISNKVFGNRNASFLTKKIIVHTKKRKENKNTTNFLNLSPDKYINSYITVETIRIVNYLKKRCTC